VRVITFDPDFSVELCGGTHVKATGNIGYFRFVSESSVASGVRRVEAVAGQAADSELRKEKLLLDQVQTLVGNQKDIVEGIKELIDTNRRLEKELQSLKESEAGDALDSILSNGEDLDGINLYTGTVPNADMDTLKQLGYDAIQKTGKQSVIVLGAVEDESGKVYLMSALTDDLVKQGMKAGSLVSNLGKIVGGGGGGQPNLATAGGRFPDKLKDAMDAVAPWIRENRS
ncbi:MAG: DHHA1 domain-containing protein, partial [Balneolaceae bacterium]|nr:DHHA1 domain-containing protein [Balneolaceae bacterium]